MPLYSYTAMDSSGKEVKGTINAGNESEVSSALKANGLYPSYIKLVESKKKGKKNSKVKKTGKKGGWMDIQLGPIKMPLKNLVIFTRQLSILLDAGLPLIRALRTLEKQARNKMVKRVVGETADYVEAGFTFSDALRKNSKTFDKLYVNMIKAGESAGAMELILTRLAGFMEKTARIIAKIKSAMIYPIVVMCVAGGVTVFLMVFIVPKFKKIFEELLQGMPLPGLTVFVTQMSDFLIAKVHYIIIGIIVLVVLYKMLGKTKSGLYWIDYVKYRMPIFGTLTSKTAIARFARTFSTLLASGVPVLSSLVIVRDTSGNELVRRAVQKVHDAVKEGETIAVPLASGKVFPDMVISMIEVGEETGKLSEMLEKIADTYEEEVDNAVDALTSMIEPIMIVFMAVVVGTIVISMFMPLIKIMQTLGS